MVPRKRQTMNKKGELLQLARQQVEVHKQQFNKPPVKTIEKLRMENIRQYQIKKYLIHQKLNEIIKSISSTSTANNDGSVATNDVSQSAVHGNQDTLGNVLLQTNNYLLKQQVVEDSFHRVRQASSTSSSYSKEDFEVVGYMIEEKSFHHEVQTLDSSASSISDGMDSESEETKIKNFDYDSQEQIENLMEIMKYTKLWFSKNRLCVKKPYRLSWAKEFQTFSVTKWNNIVLTGTVVFELKRNKIIKFHSRTDLPTFSKNALMFWGFISANISDILPLEGKLNVTKMRKMLSDNLFPLLSKDSDCCFFHYPDDHLSLFDSVILKNNLRQRSFERFIWPCFMDDLNPMEHLWEMMESKLCEHLCNDLDDLVSIIQNLWKYDLEFKSLYNTLVQSMPLVMQKIVETKGGTI